MKSIDGTLSKIIDEKIISLHKEFDQRFNDQTIAKMIADNINNKIELYIINKI